jgi:hypothetical protein
MWTKGSANVERRLHLATHSASYVFARFDDDVLCACSLVDGALVLVSSSDGSETEISLPCTSKKLWALSGSGLLVERASPPPGEPFLFSVSHALEEAKPVEFASNNVKPFQVVWVSEDRSTPFVLSFSHGAHTLWIVSRVASVEGGGIRADLRLTRVVELPEWQTQVNRAFLAHGVNGADVIFCAVVGSQLVCLAADQPDLRFTVSGVLDACPVRGGTDPGVDDIAVLRPGGALELFRGGVLLCALHPGPSSAVGLDGFDGEGGLDIILPNRQRQRVAVSLRDRLSNDGVWCLLGAAKDVPGAFALRLLATVAASSDTDEWTALLTAVAGLLGGGNNAAPVGPQVWLQYILCTFKQVRLGRTNRIL